MDIKIPQCTHTIQYNVCKSCHYTVFFGKTEETALILDVEGSVFEWSSDELGIRKLVSWCITHFKVLLDHCFGASFWGSEQSMS
jgi:hypothetical protein